MLSGSGFDTSPNAYISDFTKARKKKKKVSNERQLLLTGIYLQSLVNKLALRRRFAGYS